MTVNTVIRADVRKRIMRAANHLAEEGRPFRQAQIVEAMGRSVSPSVLAYELEELRQAGELRRVRVKAGRRAALYATPEMIDNPGEHVVPDFAPGFPSAGKQIGPAWAAMWHAMADREWHDAIDLAGTGAEAGGCLPGTARNLLFPAAKRGLIEPEARFDESAKRWRSWYRRAA